MPFNTDVMPGVLDTLARMEGFVADVRAGRFVGQGGPITGLAANGGYGFRGPVGPGPRRDHPPVMPTLGGGEEAIYKAAAGTISRSRPAVV